MKQNDTIQLIRHNTGDKFQCKPFKKTKQEIEPTSLEAHILNLQEKSVYSQRKILEIDFRIMEDHVSLHRDWRAIGYAQTLSIYNRDKFSLNGVRRLKHTFEELSNLFEPLKSCQCTKDKLD